jgi:uncharacterized membrane protein YhaH (DUF805 family)
VQQPGSIDAGQVGFGEWFVRRGRITRRTWWLHYALPFIGLSLLAALADTALGYPGFSTAPQTEGTLWAVTGGPFSVLVSLFSIVPTISAGVARLHDRDHSAWWLLWCLLPVIGPIVLFVQQGFLPGTGQPNRYGPPPLRGQPGSRPWRF